MIIMAVIGGVIVMVLAWAGWHDYRNWRRGRRVSPSIAQAIRRHRRWMGQGSATWA
jgi:hypothetical protein